MMAIWRFGRRCERRWSSSLDQAASFLPSASIIAGSRCTSCCGKGMEIPASSRAFLVTRPSIPVSLFHRLPSLSPRAELALSFRFCAICAGTVPRGRVAPFFLAMRCSLAPISDVLSPVPRYLGLIHEAGCDRPRQFQRNLRPSPAWTLRLTSCIQCSSASSSSREQESRVEDQRPPHITRRSCWAGA